MSCSVLVLMLAESSPTWFFATFASSCDSLVYPELQRNRFCNTWSPWLYDQRRRTRTLLLSQKTRWLPSEHFASRPRFPLLSTDHSYSLCGSPICLSRRYTLVFFLKDYVSPWSRRQHLTAQVDSPTFVHPKIYVSCLYLPAFGEVAGC